MTWSSNLNIYRVNRFHPIDLDDGKERNANNNSWGNRVQRFDFVEALLMRNMVDVVEAGAGTDEVEAAAVGVAAQLVARGEPLVVAVVLPHLPLEQQVQHHLVKY